MSAKIIVIVALCVVAAGGIGVGIYFAITSTRSNEPPCVVEEIVLQNSTGNFSYFSNSITLANAISANEIVYFTFDFTHTAHRDVYLNGPDWSELVCSNTNYASLSSSFFTDVRVDKENGIFFVAYGCRYGTGQPGADIFVEARFLNGTLIWRNQYWQVALISAMEFEPLTQSLFVALYSVPYIGSPNGTAMLKLDPLDGAQLWSTGFLPTFDLVYLSADTNSLYATSTSCKISTFDTTDGSLISSVNPPESPTSCVGITNDGEGNVYIVFQASSSFNGQPFSPVYKLVVAKYTTSGSLIWATEFGNTYNTISDKKPIAFYNNNIYVMWQPNDGVNFFPPSLGVLSKNSGSIQIQNYTVTVTPIYIATPISGNTLYFGTLERSTTMLNISLHSFCI